MPKTASFSLHNPFLKQNISVICIRISEWLISYIPTDTFKIPSSFLFLILPQTFLALFFLLKFPIDFHKRPFFYA